MVEERIFCGQVDRGGDFLRRKSAFPGLVNGPILLLAILFAKVVKRNKDGARIPDAYFKTHNNSAHLELGF